MRLHPAADPWGMPLKTKKPSAMYKKLKMVSILQCLYSIKSRLISRLPAECVSAPTEMKSTPVRAISLTL